MSIKVRRPDAARRQAAAAVAVGFTADRNHTICDVVWTVRAHQVGCTSH
jgi:hypothetical protein